MKIKEGSNHILFFDILFSILLILICTLSYFLGFDVTLNGIIIYFSIILAIITINLSIYFIFLKLCKTCIYFDKDKICKIKKEKVIVLVDYDSIYHSRYHPMINIFVGDFLAGNLVIYCYINNKKEEVHIAISKRKLKKIESKVKLQ